MSSSERNINEELAGVGRTLSVLAEGLLQSGFLDPGEEPTTYSITGEFVDDVHDATKTGQIDTTKITLLYLQVVRLAHAAGVRPTVAGDGQSQGVGIEVIDVAAGLETLQQLDDDFSLEIRATAAAISVLVDYAFVILTEVFRDSNQDLDIESVTRGALAVAELSCRKGIEPVPRTRAAIDFMRAVADRIESDLEDDEVGESQAND